jgi:predicted acylesterase/phospholipase RssA
MLVLESCVRRLPVTAVAGRPAPSAGLRPVMLGMPTGRWRSGPALVTALDLYGGGGLRAVQVGMLQALAARGIEPGVLVGKSAGALTAVYDAGHGADGTVLQRLDRIWTTVRPRTIGFLRPARRGVRRVREPR